jgi:hypothetical protein
MRQYMKLKVRPSLVVKAALIFVLGVGSVNARSGNQGCCSHHGGVAGCDSKVGSLVCRDGTYSPTCGCPKAAIPTNCARGYHREGRDCVAVRVPENARLDVSGHDWRCNTGYARSGQSCMSPAASSTVPAATPLAEATLKPSAEKQPAAELIVYVNPGGKKYHIKGCRFLGKSAIAMPLSEASRGHGACLTCKPPIPEGERRR